MKKIIFLLLVGCLGACMALDFRMPLRAACGSDFFTAVFGTAPGATEGLDVGLDVPELPTFFFHLYFLRTGTSAFDFTTDIRSDMETLLVWDGVTANEGGATVLLTWSPDSFPADSGQLLIGYHLPGDTVSAWLDMTEEDSLSFTVGNRVQIVLRRDIDIFEYDTVPPEIVSWSIAPYETIHVDTFPLAVTVRDTESHVDTASVAFSINGIDITWILSTVVIGDEATFTYEPFAVLPYGSTTSVAFSVADYAGNIISDAFEFYCFPEDTGDTIADNIVSGMVFLSGGSIFLSGSKVMIPSLGLQCTTNYIGQYELPPVPTDTYTIVADREGYFPIDTTVYVASDMIINFTLESAESTWVRIIGNVTLVGETDHSGSIVSARTLMADAAADTTDASGHYMIEGLMPGFYYVRAEHAGFYADSTIVVAFGDTVLNFMLERAGIDERQNFTQRTAVTVLYSAQNAVVFDCSNIASIEILDIAGRCVSSLPIGKDRRTQWNLNDGHGAVVPSGAYFVRATGIYGDIVATRIIIVR